MSVDELEFETWRRPPGIFVLVNVPGSLGERIREIQRQFDPKLANLAPPHLTLAGSSGVGPIDAATPREELLEKLAAVARVCAPLVLPFGAPVRFMATQIIALPLDPHGPVRALHEGVARSGLRFQPVRHAFTPHVTLNFFRTLSPEQRRELLSLRLDEPMVIDRFYCSLTDEPQPPTMLAEFPFGGR